MRKQLRVMVKQLEDAVEASLEEAVEESLHQAAAHQGSQLELPELLLPE